MSEQTVDPDEMAQMSHLHWIYTACPDVFANGSSVVLIYYWGGGQGGTQFPVPSPFPPTSLPLLPHFPPPSPPLPSPIRFFPPPDKILFLFKN